MKFNFILKNKKISLDVKTTNFITRGIGLTFKTKNTKNLIFNFSKPVTWQGDLTSIFVFFPFLAVWLDEKNRVIDKRIVRPFTIKISQKKRFYKILELPFNDKNRKIIGKILRKSEFSKYYRL